MSGSREKMITHVTSQSLCNYCPAGAQLSGSQVLHFSFAARDDTRTQHFASHSLRDDAVLGLAVT